MNKLIVSGSLLLTLMSAITSCKTYSVPVANFKKLFEGKERTKDYSFTGPMNIHVSYKIYPIDSIKGFDKKGT